MSGPLNPTLFVVELGGSFGCVVPAEVAQQLAPAAARLLARARADGDEQSAVVLTALRAVASTAVSTAEYRGETTEDDPVILDPMTVAEIAQATGTGERNVRARLGRGGLRGMRTERGWVAARADVEAARWRSR
jgi:hypothetical protein